MYLVWWCMSSRAGLPGVEARASIIRLLSFSRQRSCHSRHFVAPAPQIGYSTVFFWEYFGPLVTYAVFYFFPHVFYPSYKCACPAHWPVPWHAAHCMSCS